MSTFPAYAMCVFAFSLTLNTTEHGKSILNSNATCFFFVDVKIVSYHLPKMRYARTKYRNDTQMSI